MRTEFFEPLNVKMLPAAAALAPLINLSYGRMVIMAFPYTIVLGGVGYWAVTQFIVG